MNTQKNEKPWHRNAGNFIVINSISAAVSSLFIVFLFGDPCLKCKIAWLFNTAISLNFIALLVFIITAEQIAMAVEEDDVRKHIAYMLPYNFGVICLIISLGLVLFFRILTPGWWRWVVAVVGILFCYPWVDWILWLLGVKKGEFEKYKSKLKGKQLVVSESEPGQDWEDECFLSYTKIFYCVRRKRIFCWVWRAWEWAKRIPCWLRRHPCVIPFSIFFCFISA